MSMDPIELDRARLNREMVRRAAQREAYCAGGDLAGGHTPTPEEIAQAKLLALRELARKRIKQTPENLAALQARGLGGMMSDETDEVRALALRLRDEILAEEEHRRIEREMTATRRQEQRATRATQRSPQVAGLPAGVTVKRARLMDLYLTHNASQGEIAKLETIARNTVKNTITPMLTLMGVRTKAEARPIWRQWCAAAGYTSDALLAERLALLRGVSPLCYEPYTLSAVQRQVLLLRVEGLTVPQMAVRLRLPQSTIKRHLSETYKAMGVRSAGAAVARYHAEEQAEAAADVV